MGASERNEIKRDTLTDKVGEKRGAESSAEEPPTKRAMTANPTEKAVTSTESNPVAPTKAKRSSEPGTMKTDPKQTKELPTVIASIKASTSLAPVAGEATPNLTKESSTGVTDETAACTATSPQVAPFRIEIGSKKTSPAKMKGLRHFSMMVCKKVEEKGTTTYNEVADELVQKVIEERQKEDPNGKFDEKNIRRRVYDSINVLLAMDVIAKDKKQITWKGLPSSAQHDLQLLEREEQFRKEQVQSKRKALQEILLQHICFRNLVAHNKQREAETLRAEKVPLPFVVVNSHKDATINCNMAPDMSSVGFEFDRSFEINYDYSILMRLGMHTTDLSTITEIGPKDMVTYCQEHGLLDAFLGSKDAPTAPGVPYFTSLD